MEGHKILITTSGIGSRLGELTDFTNKSLVRVSDKPSISYIIEGYPKDSRFVVSLGHYGDHVRQFLKMAYPDRNFEFVDVDRYAGEGSSLGYSIFKCREYLQCPFIFHACDTIISEYSSISPFKNYVVCSDREDSSQYRTINANGKKLVKINEKGEIGYDYSYVGIAGIKEFEPFFSSLERILEDGGDISDVHCINMMLESCDFDVEVLGGERWFDIGNSNELSRTRKSFKSSIHVLDKKDESIFFFEDFVIKFFHDEDVCRNRVERAKLLDGMVPTILDHSKNFYKYKKVEGRLFSESVRRDSFIKFLEWSKKRLWTEATCDSFKEICRDFYIDKTKKRVSSYLSSNVDCKVINGCNVGGIYELLESIDSDWLCSGMPARFHGDFILDNIIETEESFALIDWRQDFGGNIEIGDIYYDLSKMNHNLVVNHDIVSRGLYSASIEDTHILMNTRLMECREILHEFIEKNGYDIDKVNLITSLIWINMAPLHDHPFGKFLFNFGKYNLFKSLNKLNN